MGKDAGGQSAGLRRWQGWLEGWFTRSRLARMGEVAEAGGARGVTWSVEIRYGKHGRIRVAESALDLDGERFEEVVRALEREDWYGRLEESLTIRIDGEGRVETTG